MAKQLAEELLQVNQEGIELDFGIQEESLQGQVHQVHQMKDLQVEEQPLREVEEIIHHLPLELRILLPEEAVQKLPQLKIRVQKTALIHMEEIGKKVG